MRSHPGAPLCPRPTKGTKGRRRDGDGPEPPSGPIAPAPTITDPVRARVEGSHRHTTRPGRRPPAGVKPRIRPRGGEGRARQQRSRRTSRDRSPPTPRPRNRPTGATASLDVGEALRDRGVDAGRWFDAGPPPLRASRSASPVLVGITPRSRRLSRVLV